MKYYLEDYYAEDGELLFKSLYRRTATFDSYLFCPSQESNVVCGEWCPFFEVLPNQYAAGATEHTATKVRLGCKATVITLLVEKEEVPDGASL